MLLHRWVDKCTWSNLEILKNIVDFVNLFDFYCSDLSGNRLRSIPVNAFQGLTSLQVLWVPLVFFWLRNTCTDWDECEAMSSRGWVWFSGATNDCTSQVKEKAIYGWSVLRSIRNAISCWRTCQHYCNVVGQVQSLEKIWQDWKTICFHEQPHALHCLQIFPSFRKEASFLKSS